MRVLVLGDDAKIASSVERGLKLAGDAVDYALDGETRLALAEWMEETDRLLHLLEVREAAATHGGSATAGDAPAGGAWFQIRLPAGV